MKKYQGLKELIGVIAICVAIYIVSKQELPIRLLVIVIVLIAYGAYQLLVRLKKPAKEKLFDCVYERKIIAANSDEVVVEMELKHTLPFAPYPGLEVVDQFFPMGPDDDMDTHHFGAYHTGIINKVIWRYSKFDCECEPHKLDSKYSLGEELYHLYTQEWKFGIGLYEQQKKALEDYVESELQRLEGLPDSERKLKKLKHVKERMKRD